LITPEVQKMIDDAVRELKIKEERSVIRKFTPGGVDTKMKLDYHNTDNFDSFTDYLRTVKMNPHDARLKSGLSEGTDSVGGFTVPEGFSNQILMTAVESSVIRPHGATILKMSSDTLKVPKIKDTSHEAGSGVHGGLIAYWTEEAGTKTVEEPTFGQVNLIAKKLTGYTYASDELLSDSALPLDTLIIKAFGETLSWYEDEAFINGSGVGEPLGILNSGATISSARATASQVELADIANMWSRLYPSSVNRAVWLCNPSVLAQIAQLATTSLTWLQLDQGVAKPLPMTLMGRPIYMTEKLPALGTAADLMLVDLSYYLIGDRQRLTVKASEHVRFTTDETAFRFVQRVDGQPWVDSVFTPKNGSTLSPFIALAAG
jgi:HK97 family phage major capsid protein